LTYSSDRAACCSALSCGMGSITGCAGREAGEAGEEPKCVVDTDNRKQN